MSVLTGWCIARQQAVTIKIRHCFRHRFEVHVRSAVAHGSPKCDKHGTGQQIRYQGSIQAFERSMRDVRFQVLPKSQCQVSWNARNCLPTFLIA